MEALAAAVNLMAVGSSPSAGRLEFGAGPLPTPGQQHTPALPATPAGPHGPGTSSSQGVRTPGAYGASTPNSAATPGADKQGTNASATEYLKQLLRDGKVKLKMDSFDPSLLPKIVSAPVSHLAHCAALSTAALRPHYSPTHC
jgi:hypothetical protein